MCQTLSQSSLTEALKTFFAQQVEGAGVRWAEWWLQAFSRIEASLSERQLELLTVLIERLDVPLSDARGCQVSLCVREHKLLIIILGTPTSPIYITPRTGASGHVEEGG